MYWQIILYKYKKLFFIFFAIIMSSLDWVYPVDVVEEIKSQPGGIYQEPAKWVSMGKFWDEIRTIVWIDPRVFDNETQED
jgi:hypothetical protein